ncbi:MAG: DUF1552 domain-containing protein [Polyangiaceae bacterium]|nr:DUF1552 domain-containing protein [Polyangiaceae bacterium]
MLADLQTSLLASAIGCGMTNIGSIQFDRNENSGTHFNWLFTDTRGHHELSHISDPDELGKLTQIYTWYATQLASLMTKLAAFPEGQGTALDNTLILDELGLVPRGVESHCRSGAAIACSLPAWLTHA